MLKKLQFIYNLQASAKVSVLPNNIITIIYLRKYLSSI